MCAPKQYICRCRPCGQHDFLILHLSLARGLTTVWRCFKVIVSSSLTTMVESSRITRTCHVKLVRGVGFLRPKLS